MPRYTNLGALRDPRFIREFKAAHCVELFAENVTTKKKCLIPPLLLSS